MTPVNCNSHHSLCAPGNVPSPLMSGCVCPCLLWLPKSHTQAEPALAQQPLPLVQRIAFPSDSASIFYGKEIKTLLIKPGEAETHGAMSLVGQDLECQKEKPVCSCGIHVGLSGAVSGSVQPWAAAPFVVTSVPACTSPWARLGSAFGFGGSGIREADRFRGIGSCGALPPRPQYLLEDFCRRLVRAVEYHIELLALLHFLQKRPGILVPRGQLADFDLDVVSGRGFDELLQAN